MKSEQPLPRHFFVVNPLCFQNRLKMEIFISKIHQYFAAEEASGVKADYAIHISRFPRDAIYSIHKFAKAAADGIPLRVYSIGGKGILFDCLNGVIELPNTELGIIPYSEDETFYQICGTQKKEIFYSIKAQTTSPSIPVDVMYCGSNYVLNYCLIGAEALASYANQKLLKRFSMLRAFKSSTKRIIDNCKFLDMLANSHLLTQNYRMWVDDVNWSGTHAFINIANTTYFENSLSPVVEAVVDDGWMDVLTGEGGNVLKLYKIFKKYISGQHAMYPKFFTYKRAKKIFITSNTPLILNIDGEIFYDKYINIEIKPKMLRIITPIEINKE
jgi:diacylglycerol kinase family enzyme